MLVVFLCCIWLLLVFRVFLGIGMISLFYPCSCCVFDFSYFLGNNVLNTFMNFGFMWG